jgi:hypothetical protein
MLSSLSRARRVALPLPITYRVAGGREWLQGQIFNISESGVLFGPTRLPPGTEVEVIFSTPIQVGRMASGKQVCVAKVVRTSEVGAAAQFEECRFLLEA